MCTCLCVWERVWVCVLVCVCMSMWLCEVYVCMSVCAWECAWVWVCAWVCGACVCAWVCECVHECVEYECVHECVECARVCVVGIQVTLRWITSLSTNTFTEASRLQWLRVHRNWCDSFWDPVNVSHGRGWGRAAACCIWALRGFQDSFITDVNSAWGRDSPQCRVTSPAPASRFKPRFPGLQSGNDSGAPVTGFEGRRTAWTGAGEQLTLPRTAGATDMRWMSQGEALESQLCERATLEEYRKKMLQTHSVFKLCLIQLTKKAQYPPMERTMANWLKTFWKENYEEWESNIKKGVCPRRAGTFALIPSPWPHGLGTKVRS